MTSTVDLTMLPTISQPSPPLQTGTRLRQIALVAKDLEQAKHLLTKVLGAEVVYVDPRVARWGLKNFLIAIGGDIIEVVSPIEPKTTAGRLLSKRGDGGYMIIMQTGDATARRSYLESTAKAKVIFNHEGEDFVCVQYHPKGIKGGMMPELDSHSASRSNPDPLLDRFSCWHPCGPDYTSYSAGMKRSSYLHFMGAVCRLAPEDKDTEGAAQQWEDLFGVARTGNTLTFSNMRMAFEEGIEGEMEGLKSITIGVKGKERFDRILDRARQENLCGERWINMLGVKWYFELLKEDGARSML